MLASINIRKNQKPILASFPRHRFTRRMESHEWKEQTDDGRRFYRANFRGGRWTFLTTTMKRDPVWDTIHQPTIDQWRELRTLVWNKYQRKRCPYERVEGIDRNIAKLENPG